MPRRKKARKRKSPAKSFIAKLPKRLALSLYDVDQLRKKTYNVNPHQGGVPEIFGTYQNHSPYVEMLQYTEETAPIHYTPGMKDQTEPIYHTPFAIPADEDETPIARLALRWT